MTFILEMAVALLHVVPSMGRLQLADVSLLIYSFSNKVSCFYKPKEWLMHVHKCMAYLMLTLQYLYIFNTYIYTPLVVNLVVTLGRVLNGLKPREMHLYEEIVLVKTLMVCKEFCNFD